MLIYYFLLLAKTLKGIKEIKYPARQQLADPRGEDSTVDTQFGYGSRNISLAYFMGQSY